MRFMLSFVAVLAVGCADQGPVDSGAGAGGAGGKADSGSTTSGALVEVDETGQSYLRAADAECLHVNYTRNETYDQAVKLFCMPRGGVAAPIELYVAVTPLGEADGAYKVFDLPLFFGDVPEAVTFRMDGDRAVYSFTAKQPNVESDDLVLVDRSVTASVVFSGASEDPTVTGSYSITE